MKQKARILSIASLILILFLAGCNFPFFSPPSLPPGSLEQTAVAQTLAARQEQGDAPSKPGSDPGQQDYNDPGSSSSGPAATPPPTPTLQPTPTKVPTQASSGAAAQPLNLGGINTSVAEVYYGNCTTEPTLLGVGIPITPQDEVNSAILWYEIANHTSSFGPFWVSMTAAAVGDFSAEINIGLEGPTTLVNTGGWVNYWVEATGKDGKTYTSGSFSTNIWYCPGGGSSGGAQAPIVNWFSGPVSVSPDEFVTISWDVSNAPCGVYVDSAQVAASDSMSYTVPAQGAPSQYTHQLIAYGEPCANPIIVIDDFSIQVNQPQLPAQPTNFSFDGWSSGPTATFWWNDNSDDELGFHIWDSSGLIDTVGPNTTSWQVILSGFCGHELSYQVSAFNSVGDSTRSAVATTYGLCPPAPPTLQKFSAFDSETKFYVTLYGIAISFNIYVDSVLWYENTTLTDFDYPIACGETVWVHATGLNFAGESDPSNYLKIVGYCP